MVTVTDKEFHVLSWLAQQENLECHGSPLAKAMLLDNIMSESTAYRVLGELETNALLSFRLETSKQGPPKKLYKLESAGIDAVKNRILEVIDMGNTILANIAKNEDDDNSSRAKNVGP